ncbi:hypothetical protein SNE40_008981 [Patella caerulea]|uniref:Arpin n=1 Tax=Patella caerulea TaxID=87958 RepID=A0AAN8JMZ5_PATCE
MSRLYDNTPLTNLPQNNINWPSVWNEDTWISKGEGVILEACIKGKSKIAVTDTSNKRVKYFVFHVQPGRVHRRKFDPNGKEIEPNFSETTKVMTGYLNSSYKTEAKGKTDKLTEQELTDLIVKQDLKKITEKTAPNNTLSLWIQESQLDKMDLDNDDIVRIKTSGYSPFIFSIGRVEGQSATVSNFAGGEQVGGSWTDKIMAMKSSVPQDVEDNEIGDDEWDD